MDRGRDSVRHRGQEKADQACFTGAERVIRRVENRDILPTVAARTLRILASHDQTARRLLKHVWIEVKRYSAPNVANVEVSDIAGLQELTVTGDVSRYCRLVLCALCKLLTCRTVFEIGTFRGETTWLLAHNMPEVHVFTLDVPDLDATRHLRLEATDAGEYFQSWERGVRFAGTPEAARITQLFGDSATFDFSPYQGQMDLVFVDASHSYSYVRSDTEAALKLLSPTGTIVWDDYTYYPGIYSYLNELAPTLGHPILHLLGTRLAVYSRASLDLTNPRAG
ncbi:MAG TPA: class I SAM-dependent methyltransferase [Solirubrobacteraceae bacterium]